MTTRNLVLLLCLALAAAGCASSGDGVEVEGASQQADIAAEAPAEPAPDTAESEPTTTSTEPVEAVSTAESDRPESEDEPEAEQESGTEADLDEPPWVATAPEPADEPLPPATEAPTTTSTPLPPATPPTSPAPAATDAPPKTAPTPEPETAELGGDTELATPPKKAEVGPAPTEKPTDPLPADPAVDPAGGGWLDGEPPAETSVDFTSEGAAASSGAVVPSTTTAARAPDLATADRAAIPDSMPIAPPAEPIPGDPIEIPCCDERRPPVQQGPLRAGSIDDGADVDRYLSYRSTINNAGVLTRPLDVFGSTVILVRGDDGRPVLDAEITVSAASGASTSLRSTATGSVRFLPNPMDASATDFTVKVSAGSRSETLEFTKGQAEVEITLEGAGGIDGSVPLDVHFVLDATGSMSSQIAQLRTNMASIADQIAALPSQPDTRFGMTIYRDEGDDFVTRTFDLTNDLAAFQEALSLVVANGGGDYAEAMDEAIAEALLKPSWRRDGAVELMITVADAPPQVARQVEQGTNDSAALASALGVKIFPIAVAGADDQTEYAMREMAFVTGGRFVFLSKDGGDSTTTGERTDIGADDFSELPLDELVVKLVSDELTELS